MLLFFYLHYTIFIFDCVSALSLVVATLDNQVSEMKVTKKDRQNRGSVDRGRKGTGANAKSKKLEAGKTTGHNSDVSEE